ncbi:alpha/beta fold hydrolase [Reinekea blandensis]|uniref:Putative hydrolase n=1 Tax=Reinekea blandensis MED297 TaxID=314283 RepID=A4B9Z8_9GAMM|nr:alpha/beta hydrolase [Reinekea blandensis]EAR11449.1 putative hydrolase [Reinekea sp. MED297] [Reinekea blandensis MED297]
MREKLYLLPGTQCDDRLWAPLVTRLFDTVELVPLAIPMNMGFPDIAELLVSQLSESTVNLLGFSLGGYVAAEIAVRYPERIARLCVLANSPKPLPTAELEQRAQALRLIDKVGYRGMSRLRAKSLLDPSHHDDEWIDQLIAMDRAQGVEKLKSQLRDTSDRRDLFAPLSQWHKPILFCASEGDDLVDTEWLTRLSKQNAQVDVHWISSRGHMLPLEHPDSLADAIRKWLTKVGT